MKKIRLYFGLTSVIFHLALFFMLNIGYVCAQDSDTPLNINGSFESAEPGEISDPEALEGWVLNGIDMLANLSIVEEPVQHGDNALSVEILQEGDNAYSIEATAVEIPVEPGRDYRYSVWAKAEQPGAQISITVGNYSYNEYGRQTVDLTDDWQQFTYVFSITDGEVEIRAPIHFSYEENLGNTIYVDNLEITKIAELDDQWEGPPLATGHDKWLGNLSSRPQLPQFEVYWNQVTPENAGKWGSVAGQGTTQDPGTWNWDNLDDAYNLAKDNGFPFRFHVLVWGNQQPPWMPGLADDPEEQLAIVESWFEAVAQRYPDIEYVEVVNEPLHDPPDEDPDNAGAGNYIEALGGKGETDWDWVLTAFRMARKIFPESTKLMINEYNIMSGGSNLTNYLELIELLKGEDLIDRIGIQGHAFSYWASPQDIVSNIDQLAETGLPIQVTEFDMDGPTDRTHLENYKRYFPILWEHPGIEGITLWGWRHGMWRTDQGAYLIDPDDGSERPALKWLRSYLHDMWGLGILEPEGNGTVDPEAGDYYYSEGEEITLTASPADGWIFSHWEGNVDDVNSSATSITIDSHYDIIKAYFEEETPQDDDTTFVDDYRVNSVELLKNYPNPFSHSTKISYKVNETTNVALKVFDLEGRLVKTLVDEEKSPGTYNVKFDAENLTNGVYLYRLEAGSYIDNERMIIVK